MVNYKEIINTEPLGSIKRLYLICNYGKSEQSKAAERCINKRLKRMNNEHKRKNFKNNNRNI